MGYVLADGVRDFATLYPFYETQPRDLGWGGFAGRFSRNYLRRGAGYRLIRFWLRYFLATPKCKPPPQ
ncbi:hypothetical protein [Hymenobacter antarcticus]|uniref:hypothetical protein n=1 Tax=Hymenobacter antarcticus TaxID=486270 RepID=UPI0031ECFC98